MSCKKPFKSRAQTVLTVLEALQELIDDGLVQEVVRPDGEVSYTLTITGRLVLDIELSQDDDETQEFET